MTPGGHVMGGVGAVPAALADRADGPDLLKCQVEQLVGPSFSSPRFKNA